jgi:hypothetical protein
MSLYRVMKISSKRIQKILNSQSQTRKHKNKTKHRSKKNKGTTKKYMKPKNLRFTTLKHRGGARLQNDDGSKDKLQIEKENEWKKALIKYEDVAIKYKKWVDGEKKGQEPTSTNDAIDKYFRPIVDNTPKSSLMILANNFMSIFTGAKPTSQQREDIVKQINDFVTREKLLSKIDWNTVSQDILNDANKSILKLLQDVPSAVEKFVLLGFGPGSVAAFELELSNIEENTELLKLEISEQIKKVQTVYHDNTVSVTDVENSYNSLHSSIEELVKLQTNYENIAQAMVLSHVNTGQNETTLIGSQDTVINFEIDNLDKNLLSRYQNTISSILDSELEDFSKYVDNLESLPGTEIKLIIKLNDNVEFSGGSNGSQYKYKSISQDDIKKAIKDVSKTKKSADANQDADANANDDANQDAEANADANDNANDEVLNKDNSSIDEISKNAYICENNKSWVDVGKKTIIEPMPNPDVENKAEIMKKRSIGREVVELCSFSSNGDVTEGFERTKVFAGGDCGHIATMLYLQEQLKENTFIYNRLPVELKEIITKTVLVGDGTQESPIKIASENTGIIEFRAFLRKDLKLPEDANNFMEDVELSKLANIMGNTIAVWQGETTNQNNLDVNSWRYFDNLGASGILTLKPNDIPDNIPKPFMLVMSGELSSGITSNSHFDYVKVKDDNSRVFKLNNQLEEPFNSVNHEDVNRPEPVEGKYDEGYIDNYTTPVATPVADDDKRKPEEGKYEVEDNTTLYDGDDEEEKKKEEKEEEEGDDNATPPPPVVTPDDDDDEGDDDKGDDDDEKPKPIANTSAKTVTTTTTTTPVKGGTNVTVKIYIPDGAIYDVSGPGGNNFDSMIKGLTSSINSDDK